MAYFALEQPPVNWEAWVTRVARNKKIDYKRSLKKRASFVAPQVKNDPDASFGARIDRFEYRNSRFSRGPSGAANARVLLDVVFDDFSDRDRVLLEAHAAGASNDDLSKQFGFANAGTVAATVSRLKRRLREQLADLADDPAHPRLY